MEGTQKEHGRNLDDSGNTTRRGTGNRTTRTIRIRKYFEAGPDHIGRQGRIGSSLCRPRVRYGTFQRLVSIILRVLRDVTSALVRDALHIPFLKPEFLTQNVHVLLV